jgi:hypothetical protein
MRNPVIQHASIGHQPCRRIVCRTCEHGLWYQQAGSGLHCKCLLISAQSWTSRQGEHGIIKCEGNEDDGLRKQVNDATVCKRCQEAVWWESDEKKLRCYCKKMYMLTYGKDMKGKEIELIKDCNVVNPREES